MDFTDGHELLGAQSDAQSLSETEVRRAAGCQPTEGAGRDRRTDWGANLFDCLMSALGLQTSGSDAAYEIGGVDRAQLVEFCRESPDFIVTKDGKRGRILSIAMVAIESH